MPLFFEEGFRVASVPVPGTIVADPGSGAFLTPGSGIWD
jgi:hypothetical protein